MVKLLLLFVPFLCVISVQAQYFNAKKGAVAYYITVDRKKNEILKDTASVIDVKDEDNRLTMRQTVHGDRYAVRSIMNGNNLQTMDGNSLQTYVYHKDTGVTEINLLDSEMENEWIRKRILSTYPENRREEAEKACAEYSKVIRTEGRIIIPLRENAKEGEEVPPCTYCQKMNTVTMKAYLKGKYKGREIIRTPAGDFDCIKVYTENKAKFMFFSETEYTMDWYAEGIGLVKSEELTKRGKVLSTTLLQAIEE